MSIPAVHDGDHVAVELLGHLVVTQQGPSRLLAHVLDVVGLLDQCGPKGGLNSISTNPEGNDPIKLRAIGP